MAATSSRSTPIDGGSSPSVTTRGGSLLDSRWSIRGLLIVCALLAAGLGLMAWLSYRAAERAAKDVLFSRGADVAASFMAAARVMRLEEREALSRLAKEVAGDEVALAVVRIDGRVVATSGEETQRRSIDVTVLNELRLSGRSHRIVARAGARVLEYWQPLGPGPRRGRGWRGWSPPGEARPPGGPVPPDEAGDRRPRRRRRWARRLRRGGLLLVRVTVPYATAEGLLAPARTAGTMAGVVSLSLLGVGLLLFFAARRAHRAEHQLVRREGLAALGEMAAVLAHEIRTPLASIKGNAQLLGEAAPGDDRARAVVQESGRLERLVNGMLDYARPAELRLDQVDPDALVRRAAEMVLPQANAVGVDLLTEPAGCGACLRADPDQLLQVLVNLLQNAVDACAAQSSREPVVVAAKRVGGALQLVVLDRGPGLSEPADRLMQPFFTAKPQGTGLGLSIARQIVLRHGGRLALQAREGGGARAEVMLPLRAPGGEP